MADITRTVGSWLALSMLLGVILPLPSSALGSQTRTMTLYAAGCPAGYNGDASADECDDNPLPSVLFRVGRPFTEAFTEFTPSDADGLVDFDITGLSMGGTIRVIQQKPDNSDRAVAYCVDASGEPLDISYPADIGNDALSVVDVTVGDAGDIACDWYIVPASASSDTSLRHYGDTLDDVQFVEDPSWWVVPFAEGYGNTDEGKLVFAATVVNPTDETISVGVSFRAYEADGTPFPGCQFPGGDGPGVSTTIASGEMARLTCVRSVVPNDLDGLQVTARLWDVQTVPYPAAPVDISDVDYEIDPTSSSPMETSFGASGLVRSKSTRDFNVQLLFRFYDDQDVQVGTCESDSVVLEPEVNQRVTCSFPLLLDTVSPQPARVEAQAFQMVV